MSDSSHFVLDIIQPTGNVAQEGNMSKTYGVQYNVTDRSYTVIVNGVTGRNFKTAEAANEWIDQSKRAPEAKCNVITPMCPDGEMGDVYVSDIKQNARRIV